MPIPCPSVQWPSELEERGPAEDPAILLTGTAHIGGAKMQIVAIRIDPAQRLMPDYRDEVAEERYEADGLGAAMETALDELDYVATELAEVLGGSQSSIVELDDRPYRLWLMPASFTA